MKILLILTGAYVGSWITIMWLHRKFCDHCIDEQVRNAQDCDCEYGDCPEKRSEN